MLKTFLIASALFVSIPAMAQVQQAEKGKGLSFINGKGVSSLVKGADVAGQPVQAPTLQAPIQAPTQAPALQAPVQAPTHIAPTQAPALGFAPPAQQGDLGQQGVQGQQAEPVNGNGNGQQ